MIIGKASWTGNGNTPRIISTEDIHIATPTVVIVHGVNKPAQIWINGMPGSVPLSKPITGYGTQTISSATPGAFVIGSDAVVNASGTSYFAEMFYVGGTNSGDISVGTYNGTGTLNTILTASKAWDCVITIPTGSNSDVCAWKTTPMGGANSQLLNSGIVTNLITGLSTGQFTLDSSNSVNRNGEKFFYVALQSATNSTADFFSYTGTGATHNVGAASFNPTIGFTKGDQASAGVLRHADEVDPESMGTSGQAEIPSGIYSLVGGGFTVGTNAAVNTNGTTYYAMSLKDGP